MSRPANTRPQKSSALQVTLRAAVTAALVLQGTIQAADSTLPKPNIVHILTDDLGWQDVAAKDPGGPFFLNLSGDPVRAEEREALKERLRGLIREFEDPVELPMLGTSGTAKGAKGA